MAHVVFARSILAAILLHFARNFALNVLSPVSDRLFLLMTTLLAVTAIFAVIVWGARTLTYQQQR